MRANVAHDAQPASAAVVASVTTHTIGAAEAFRSHGSEDGATGRVPNAPGSVHHMRASAHPAGRFPVMAPYSGAVRVTGVTSLNSPAATTYEPVAAGTFSGVSPLAVAGAVLFDLWPVWAAVAVGLILAGAA